jgi:iron complex outermembrane receptor protein
LVLFGIFLLVAVYTGNASEKKEDRPAKKEEESQYYHVVENVVVTATMSKKSLKDCSTSVEILETDDLNVISASNALHILNYCPGIFVRKSGDFGRADVDIRGLGQNGRRIAVLVNGRPEKMGLFGCAVTHAFPLDNVERIEVIKGPASVLYGGEALGGVINIITRTPKDRLETNLSASFGSFNTQQFNLQHGGQMKKIKYFLTFDRQQSDGHIKNSSYDGYSFTGRVDYHISPRFQISLQGKYFQGKKYEPGPVDSPLEDYWNDYKRGAVDLTFSRIEDGHEFSLKIYRNFGNHQFSDGWDSRDFTNGGILRYTNRQIRNMVVTVGSDFRSFGGQSFSWPAGEWDKHEGSIFFHNEFGLGANFIFTGGLRLQLDSLYGWELCPHLGSVFRIGENTSLRGVINKGFRSPQLNELFMFPAANPDLEPERVWNYELGIEHDINNRIKLLAGLFHMNGSNLIETISQGGDSQQPFVFRNTGEFNFYGIEAGFKLHFGHLFASEITYSYLNPGEKTKGRPGQKLDFSMRFSKNGVLLSLQGQYITDYFASDQSTDQLPSYWLINSRLIFKVSKHFEMVLDVNNILDSDYLVFGEFPGLSSGSYQMPGRNIQAGIRFKE